MERNNTEDDALCLSKQKKGNCSAICFKKVLNSKTTQSSRFKLRESFKKRRSSSRNIDSPDLSKNHKKISNDQSKNKKRVADSTDEKNGNKRSKSKLYENEMSTPFFKKYLSKMYEDELVDAIKNYPILLNKEKISYYHTARGNSFDDQQVQKLIEKSDRERNIKKIGKSECNDISDLDNFESFRQKNFKKDEVKKNILKDFKFVSKKSNKETKLRKINTYKDNLQLADFNKTFTDNLNNVSNILPNKNISKNEGIKKNKTNRELFKKIDNRLKDSNKSKNDNNTSTNNKLLEKRHIKAEVKEIINKNFSSNPNINTRNSKLKTQLKTAENIKDIKDINYICLLCNKKVKKPLCCPRCKKAFCEQCLKNKKKKSKFCSFCNFFINDITNYIKIVASEKKTIPDKKIKKLTKFNTSLTKNFRTINEVKNRDITIDHSKTISKDKEKNENSKPLINKVESKNSLNKTNKKNNNKNNITKDENNDIKVNLKSLNLFKNIYNNRNNNVNNNFNTFSDENCINSSNIEEEKLSMNTFNTFNSNTYEEDDIIDNNIQKEKINFVKKLNKKSYDNEIKPSNEIKANIVNKIKNDDIKQDELKVKEDIITSANTNTYNNEIVNYCNEHTKEKLICYCVQCNKEFCKKCIVDKENNHLENEHKIIDYLNNSIHLNYRNIKNIIKTKNEIDKENDSLNKYVNYFSDIIKNFETEKEINLNYINNIINKNINDIENKIKELKTIINKIKIKQNILSSNKNSIQKYFDLYTNDSNEDNLIKEYNDQYQEIINNIKNNNLIGNFNLDYTFEKIKWNNINGNLIFNFFTSQIINYNKNVFNENKILLVNSKLIFDNNYFDNFIDITKKISIKNDNPSNDIELNNSIYENENNYNALYIVNKGDKAMMQISIKLSKNKNKINEELNVNKENIFGNVLLNNGEKVIDFELKEKMIYKGMLYLYDLVPWEQLINNNNYKDKYINQMGNEICFKALLCIIKN